jgi:uncharacterized protein
MMRSLLDVNLWLALSLSGHVHHQASMALFISREEEESLAFCRQTQHGLLRLLTTEAVMRAHNKPALSNDAAWALQGEWEQCPNVHMASEPKGIEGEWGRLAKRNTASPKLWMDAYLAAFAIAGGYQLVATDKAFKQFKGLNVLLLH